MAAEKKTSKKAPVFTIGVAGSTVTLTLDDTSRVLTADEVLYAKRLFGQVAL